MVHTAACASFRMETTTASARLVSYLFASFQQVIEGGSHTPSIFGFANPHYSAMAAKVGGVLGVKDSMVAHILGESGNSQCPNDISSSSKDGKGLKGPGK